MNSGYNGGPVPGAVGGFGVGEGGQRIMEHQVAVEGTLAEAVVPMRTKPEGEGARIVVVRVVLV